MKYRIPRKILRIILTILVWLTFMPIYGVFYTLNFISHGVMEWMESFDKNVLSEILKL